MRAGSTARASHRFTPENFSTPANRLHLYSKMTGVNWAGCVEARPAPYDVTDAPPSNGNPATLFVPSFAPDEPDEGVWSRILQQLTSPTAPVAAGSARPRCPASDGSASTTARRPTSRSPTAPGAAPTSSAYSNPIVPLTHSQITLSTALTAMPAYGGTNLHEGVMWGWRTLSPEPPFTEGRPYSDMQNRKIIVLMTDGANDIIGLPNMNGSFYSPYGYAAAGRLGTTSSNKADLVAKMNEKTLAACANAKALGIQIYTVAFYVTDAAALSILNQCATSPAMALVANSDQALTNAFDETATTSAASG